MNDYRTILIADHNQERLHIFGKRLKEDGFKVLISTSGKQALAIVHNKHPNLVVIEASLTLPAPLELVKEMTMFGKIAVNNIIIKGELNSSTEKKELTYLGVQEFLPATAGVEAV